MFSGLHWKVGIVFTLSKTIISDFWTQSALTHTAVSTLNSTELLQHCRKLTFSLLYFLAQNWNWGSWSLLQWSAALQHNFNCSIVLYFTVYYCISLYFTVFHCTSLYFTVLHCTSLYFTVLHCTSLYFTVLYCTSLYFTVLYCTSLYFTEIFSEVQWIT